MYCKKCGKEIPDDKKFCEECGAEVVMPQQPAIENAAAERPLAVYPMPEQMSAPNPGKKSKSKIPTKKLVALIVIAVAVIGLLVGGAFVARRIVVENKVVELAGAYFDDTIFLSPEYRVRGEVFVESKQSFYDASVTVINLSGNYTDIIIWVKSSAEYEYGKEVCYHVWGNNSDEQLNWIYFSSETSEYRKLVKEKKKHGEIKINSDRINDLLLEY